MGVDIMDDEKVNKLFATVQSIHDCLLGTYEKRGLVSKVEEHHNFIKELKDARKWQVNAVVNSIYKIGISVAIAYIVFRLGIK